MANSRRVKRTILSRATIEGAGVYLKRALGPAEVSLADPFLLFDDFHSENPEDYIAGFPWHPHRGIETVTYMIRGEVEHGDSIGNRGTIASGDVQWMTAGNGILNQEMPQKYNGMFQGFQLWVNLPAAGKMMNPRYRGVESDAIPTYSPRTGVKVKVIAGSVDGTKGPVKDLVVKVEYLDVSLGSGRKFEHEISEGNAVFAYVFEGDASFDSESTSRTGTETLVLFSDGREVAIKAGRNGARFLLVSGTPLREPVAWGGPIVMNTQRELDLAFEELRRGTFIKSR